MTQTNDAPVVPGIPAFERDLSIRLSVHNEKNHNLKRTRGQGQRTTLLNRLVLQHSVLEKRSCVRQHLQPRTKRKILTQRQLFLQWILPDLHISLRSDDSKQAKRGRTTDHTTVPVIMKP